MTSKAVVGGEGDVRGNADSTISRLTYIFFMWVSDCVVTFGVMDRKREGNFINRLTIPTDRVKFKANTSLFDPDFVLRRIWEGKYTSTLRILRVSFSTGSCHKRQKPQAPTPQAPIRNRQTRKVANAKGLNGNTNLT